MVHWNNCFAKANLSLCGCGFLCIYHAGVCAALRVYAPQLTRNKIYGASAGSIAAAGLICNVSIADATAAILQVVAEARSGVLQAFSPTFDLMGIVRDELNRVLPEDAHQLCTDRLFISLTRYEDGKNAIISEFSTKKELIQAILCSCFIPLFCGYTVPEFRGVKYIDGGFSDNQPIFDQNTITISPFSGESDICPMDHASASILGFVYYNTSIRFNNENFYRFCSCFVPPTQEICSKICRQGFTDALRFLTKNSITPCHRCLSTQSSESLYLPETKQSINYFNNAESNFPGDQRQQQPPFRKRKRLDSECEVCLNRLEQRLSTEMTTALFPEILHKTLQEPVNTSNFASQLFNYAYSFRIVRFWLGFFDPLIRYTEFAFFVLKVLNDWLRKTPKRDFFMTRLQNFVDVLLNEVEERNLLCSSPTLSSQTQQFRVNRKDKSASTEYCYPIGDFDSFESLKDNSLLHDLMVLDFYMAKLPPPSKKAKNCLPPPNLPLNLPPPNPRSPTEKQQTLALKAASRNVLALKQLSEKSIRTESNGNDSGISSSGFNSSTPAALSAVSSDDGIKKVKKRDVALSPVRNLISAIPRPKFGSRRHTVGVNSGNLTAAQAVGASSSGSAASIRRCSTQSLNKSVHSTHSLGGSKHSLMSGGSQGAASSGGQHKLRQQKQQQPAAPFLASSSDGDEEGANADDDGEQFFVPNRMASNVGGGSGGRQQRRVSDAEYDGDADPST